MLVRDYMTSRLVYVQDDTRLQLALHPMLELGITAVPVLDANHRPVGVVSLRDIVEKKPARIDARGPVLAVRDTAPIAEAAEQLTHGNVHHLVAVDEEGKAVGMLSSLDVVRALLHERHAQDLR
jgi:CBS domain-containing protein